MILFLLVQRNAEFFLTSVYLFCVLAGRFVVEVCSVDNILPLLSFMAEIFSNQEKIITALCSADTVLSYSGRFLDIVTVLTLVLRHASLRRQCKYGSDAAECGG